ncbi:MAG: LuxR C-terminal-related transcriptional regulator [Vulcanimicrobiaceae bacterium]
MLRPAHSPTIVTLPVGVGVVADRRTTAAALAEILRSDRELLLIGTATDGSDGYSLLANRALRVLIVNLSLTEHHGATPPGVQFIRNAKMQRPDVGIISLKRRVDEHQLRAALDAGADACCLATTAATRVTKAIKVVADGATWLDPEITHALFHHDVRAPEHAMQPLPHLSPREQEILRLIVEGYSNEEIAQHLNRAYPTIRTHLAHLYKKLGVTDRVSAAVTALRHGL